MSLIISIKTAEGFVMAADSRVSMHVQHKGEAPQKPLTGGISHYSDTYNKLFLAPNGAGISFCGEMAIEAGSVSFFLDRFLKEKISEQTPLVAIPSLLTEYVRSLPKIPSTIFHICGFDRDAEPAAFCFWRIVRGGHSCPSFFPGINENAAGRQCEFTGFSLGNQRFYAAGRR